MRSKVIVSFVAALFVGLALPVGPVAAQGMDGVDWMQKAQKDTAGSRTPNTLTPAEAKDGWILIFNGVDTEGWRGFKSDRVVGWEVVNGELIALGQGGDHANDIITTAEIENFELLVDWKLSPRANSGIFYNVDEKAGDRIYAVAPEYLLIDDDGWPDKLEGWQHSGANYAMHPPTKKAARKVGEWNTTRIVVNHGKVQHWLNGKKVVEYELWTPEWEKLKATGKWKDHPKYGVARSGHIGLQDHGNKVYFRNIKIRQLQ